MANNISIIVQIIEAVAAIITATFTLYSLIQLVKKDHKIDESKLKESTLGKEIEVRKNDSNHAR